MVSPNPVKDDMLLFMTGISESDILSADIFTMLGEKVQSIKINNSGSVITQQATVDAGLPNGTYFVTLFAGNKTVTKPFILNR
ncbi:MAG: T9SS type A sorting domain-containing protein [Chitinophagales bacterium]|nr:T9SS type A sorting domain-containing protein [Chitinophagales bacterium]